MIFGVTISELQVSSRKLYQMRFYRSSELQTFKVQETKINISEFHSQFSNFSFSDFDLVLFWQQ